MKSIQSKLMISFIVLTFIPVIAVGIFSYANYTRAIKQELSEAILNSLEQVSKNLDEKFTIIEDCLDMALISKEFQNALEGAPSEVWEANRELDKIVSNYINKFSYMDSTGVSIYFFSNKGGAYSYNSNNYNVSKDLWEKYSWYNNTVELNGKINWIGTIKNPGSPNKNKYVYIAGRVIRNTLKVGNGITGLIFITIDEKFIKDVYNSVEVSQSGNIIVTNKIGNIISRADKEGPYSDIRQYSFCDEVLNSQYGYNVTEIKGVTSMVVFYTSGKTGNKVISIAPYQRLTSEIRVITFLTLGILLCCMVFLSVISYIVSKSLALPIHNLRRAMAQVEKGNFNVFVSKKYTGEVGQMILSFNYMVERLKELFKKSIYEEQLKKSMEIKALQYQINPHFLYNILGAIRLKAIVDGSETVAEMINSLSRLLKRTIGKAGTTIPVIMEIQNVNDYLKIQRICYNENIDLQINVDKEVLNYTVPNLLLQPVVENAVFHGIAKKTDEPVIRITGKKLDETLVFEVYDNGVGMSEEQISQALNTQEYKKGGYTRIGLKNIHDRIKLNYGQKYGVEIKSKLGEWTLVILTIPVVKEVNNVENDKNTSG